MFRQVPTLPTPCCWCSPDSAETSNVNGESDTEHQSNQTTYRTPMNAATAPVCTHLTNQPEYVTELTRTSHPDNAQRVHTIDFRQSHFGSVSHTKTTVELTTVNPESEAAMHAETCTPHTRTRLGTVHSKTVANPATIAQQTRRTAAAHALSLGALLQLLQQVRAAVERLCPGGIRRGSDLQLH